MRKVFKTLSELKAQVHSQKEACEWEEINGKGGFCQA